jgi:hypothetical protein
MKFGEKLVLIVTILFFGIAQYNSFLLQFRESESNLEKKLTYFSSLSSEIEFNKQKVIDIRGRLEKGDIATPFYMLTEFIAPVYRPEQLMFCRPTK